jgi:hypothetical protein
LTSGKEAKRKSTSGREENLKENDDAAFGTMLKISECL